MGEFKSWRGDKARRANFLRRLGEIIRRDVNRLFMVSVELDTWNAVNKEYLLEENLYSPFAFAGLSVLVQVRKWAQRKHISSHHIKLAFEDGDSGWSGLEKLCSRSNFHPIAVPKSEAVLFQVGDLVAWKSRIAATNSLRLLSELEEQPLLEAVETFQGILDELASLDKMLVRPGLVLIYSSGAIIRTCKGSKFPKRLESR